MTSQSCFPKKVAVALAAPTLLLGLLVASAAAGNFYQNFDLTWGDGRAKILNSGQLLTLSLDKTSGSGFKSKNQYLYGKIDMQLKLVPGNSAGTVTAYYLSSLGSTHDEIDFEFLGNLSGDPYILHTNVFTQGKGNREQQFYLWFDPTKDFHTYSVLWNPRSIIFSVDGTPIREFKNLESRGIPFPKSQPMWLYSSLWNADDWATRGGLVKTDWSQAPFTASYRNFNAQACVWSSGTSSCPSGSSSSWLSQSLDTTGQQRIKWVQKNYMIYNYCTDTKRFPQGFLEGQTNVHLEPWSELPGKVVLVTGASSGLGCDFCRDLARVGCRVVAAARRVDRIKSLCDEINGLASSPSNSGTDTSSPRAVAVELDVSADGATIEKSVQKAWDAFGHIDALVNNAGVRGNVKSPLELTEEEWDHTFKTNAKGSWLVTKYVCIRMRDSHRGGSVINISSIAGLNRGQLPGGLAYASSKAALNTMTKVMALELGVYKIRVNSISPGLFKSEITQGLMQKDWLSNVALRTVPLRQYGTADPALTSLVRYLIHDSSEYVSGNIFIVDAGATLPGVPIFSSL